MLFLIDEINIHENFPTNPFLAKLKLDMLQDHYMHLQVNTENKMEEEKYICRINLFQISIFYNPIVLS